MILKCTCENAFQDKEYGVGLRVHNPCGGKNKKGLYRCTVCLKERRVAGDTNG